jgi:electron transfer flavoprotein beta subunit
MGAKKKPQETVSLADLGLSAGEAGENGSRTEVYGLSDPPSRGDSERIEDDGPAAAEKIVEYLSTHKLI